MNKSNFVPPIEPASLVELLRWRSLMHPQTGGYTFLTDGGDGELSLSYRALDRRARAIAARLQSMNAAGARVLLLFPPGLGYVEAFFGCLYAGAIAVPAYPPHPRRPMPRLQALVADSEAAFVLTTEQILQDMQQRLTHLPDLAALQWLATDSIADTLGGFWQDPQSGAETLAFLQYTSGSVGTPKGVMLTHSNLLHNCALIYRYFENSATSVGVSWLPPYHDMGLIGGILQPLYGGFPVTLMSPAYFLQQPLRWLKAISSQHATISGGPNFAYDLCARTVTAEQKAELDLSHWEVAFNGAEPVRVESMERFAAAFADCGFRREAFFPCYGLAEATLLVSGSNKDTVPITQSFYSKALEKNQAIAGVAGDAETRILVGYQKDLFPQRVLIVHPHLKSASRVKLVRCG
ncbi:AMP-binding protein [Dictyobacter kobayashii]|uniref:AMP-dependent synthetase/ligase domain-containing protein n=1 Tax=Dictyobacter kobayashii TaxID=2014872 RepID=A0A402ASK5_9CHLR|nr:AMP-binding protein [Dictyobacter kobayashii]GCE22085.1 hypothetical protein KDK_58850 [Dictyobacter kobayashii]